MANLVQMKMMEELNGVLLVDKPAGLSFSTVLKTIKRKFNLVKVGHGGSLDTLASGLFVVLIGDANKFADDIMGADREYEGSLQLGLTTDTGDIHGRPVPPSAPALSLDDLKGDIFQTEPRFCAVRKEGAAEWEIADTGEHSPFLAHVYRIKVEEVEEERVAKFELKASKGVIVRALANDLGAALATLRRTKIGKFDIKDAIPFARLLEMEAGDFAACVMPLARALRP